jgi:hypothetical protein
MPPARRFWRGSEPTSCELCNNRLRVSFYDAKTPGGPWGMICSLCFTIHDMRTGTGWGQKYERQRDGSWLKTEG